MLQRPWIVKSESTEESPVRTTVEVVREYKQKSADFCRADVYVYWAFNQYNCPLSYTNKFLLLLRLPMRVSEDLPPRCYNSSGFSSLDLRRISKNSKKFYIPWAFRSPVLLMLGTDHTALQFALLSPC